MTKVRAPLSFSIAVMTVVDLIGWTDAAAIARRAVRTIRHWSESDKKGSPTLDQAIALDRAFILAGGGYAPILESYARQIEVITGEPCRDSLAQDLALATREAGDAFSHCVQALLPGATPAQIHRAIAETEEADAIFPRLIGRLKALLPGNGAGREATGVNQ
ncbi:hypothetical protein [Novosphingobium clariflavum]|uniref:Uncharacterized protein n=1 Tax=Novosphingobium clariflavum TaxID=2029884 RepID=A0ABV6SFJ6_9SPHN|nr:hypothetical protein [Novosphingobium clariflavum]